MDQLDQVDGGRALATTDTTSASTKYFFVRTTDYFVLTSIR